jgi:hypothetical protein
MVTDLLYKASLHLRTSPLNKRRTTTLVSKVDQAQQFVVIKPPLRHTRLVEGGRRDIVVLLVGRPQRNPFTELESRHQPQHPKVLENFPGRFWGLPFRLQLTVGETSHPL